ncbi:MAG TPA: NAD(P)H-binding protein [Candidatus Elarobacter sp.]|nr:NAD(P)H-binding protein [Candidatus Elarobacter sp.]
MLDSGSRLGVTGASGKLGRLVIAQLLDRVGPGQIVSLSRGSPAQAEFRTAGLDARIADYTLPESLVVALAGVQRLLLISGAEHGQRLPQHRNVIEAALRVGVREIVYTSILHANSSQLELAGEHRETEALLAKSGLAYVVLRNGWYTENDTGSVPTAAARGEVIGASGQGRFSWAARIDYAAAAVSVLCAEHFEAGRVYELAGDNGYTRAEFAAEIARQTGSPVRYRNLAPAKYASALIGFGLPADLAGLIADAEVGAENGALFDDSRELSVLIGRPTTPLATSIALALREREPFGAA